MAGAVVRAEVVRAEVVQPAEGIQVAHNGCSKLKVNNIMKILKYIIAIYLITSAASAHEMVPTYPKLVPSHIDGLQKTSLTVFNKRYDVEFYEIGVFTKDWEPIKFVSNYKIFKVPYLSAVNFEIYIRNEDEAKAIFVCSQSKLSKAKITRTAISSRICSRFKQ